MVAHESGLSHPTIALDRWAWRIVSEDSIHPMASLPTAVHPFPESKNLVVVLVAEITGAQKENCLPPKPVVLRLRPHDRKTIEEGHDPAGKLGKSVDLPIPAAVSCLP
jgi:hypothetical protein